MKKYPKHTKLSYSKKIKSSKNELEGDELWHAFSSKITPLMHRNQHAGTSAIEYPSIQKSTATLSRAVRALPKAYPQKTGNPLSDFSHGAAAWLNRQSARKMRRGKIMIEGRLDLHGMIQTEAYRHLLDFLERAYFSGKKTIVIITGKGTTRSGEIGILRQAVPRWLNEQPIKGWIRGFVYASPSDGGVGALYILLRRRR